MDILQIKNSSADKAKRTHEKITHNPSTITPGEVLYFKIPLLGANELIVPDSIKLTYDLSITSTDTSCKFVDNIASSIVEKLVIKIGSKVVQEIDNYDIFKLYQCLHLNKNDREKMILQGIQSENIQKLRHNLTGKDASNKTDLAIATAFSTRYSIPIMFELFQNPFSPRKFNDEIDIEIKFSPSAKLLLSSDTTATYSVTNLAIEFDKIVSGEVTSLLSQHYMDHDLLYENVRNYKNYKLKNDDVSWTFDINTRSRSLKGALILFKDDSDMEGFGVDNEKFFNPNIKKVAVDIEGVSNSLFSDGLENFMHYDQITKLYCTPESYMTVGKFYNSGYGLWLDMRPSEDHSKHGNGTEIKNNFVIKIDKPAGSTKSLSAYVFLIEDGIVKIEDGRYKTKYI